MKDRYSNGARFIEEAGPIATRHACAYMHLPGAGQGAYHDANELEAGYCIDAPALMPAGSMYRSVEGNVWEQITIRRGA